MCCLLLSGVKCAHKRRHLVNEFVNLCKWCHRHASVAIFICTTTCTMHRKDLFVTPCSNVSEGEIEFVRGSVEI